MIENRLQYDILFHSIFNPNIDKKQNDFVHCIRKKYESLNVEPMNILIWTKIDNPFKRYDFWKFSLNSWNPNEPSQVGNCTTKLFSSV